MCTLKHAHKYMHIDSRNTDSNMCTNVAYVRKNIFQKHKYTHTYIYYYNYYWYYFSTGATRQGKEVTQILCTDIGYDNTTT